MNLLKHLSGGRLSRPKSFSWFVSWTPAGSLVFYIFSCIFRRIWGLHPFYCLTNSSLEQDSRLMVPTALQWATQDVRIGVKSQLWPNSWASIRLTHGEKCEIHRTLPCEYVATYLLEINGGGSVIELSITFSPENWSASQL